MSTEAIPESGPSAQAQLESAYVRDTYDSLDPVDLLADEIAQRRQTGYYVEEFVRAANATDPRDHDAVLALLDSMEHSVRAPGWAFEEPDLFEDIRSVSSSPPVSRAGIGSADYSDKVHAAWLGRIAGCNVGKPLEQGSHWTVGHIRDYLERASAYPLDDYVPVLDPMPEEFQPRESWRSTTRGNVDGSARDDDIDYTILGLHLVETHGRVIASDDIGEAWLSLLPITQTFTAERAAYRNYVNGFRAPHTARIRNPHREWIGALIRSDIFGYLHPGDPWSAAELAYRDAAFSHVSNGIYGEMWGAALVAAAFTAADAREALDTAVTVVPRRSRLRETLDHVRHLHESGVTWKEAVADIHERFDDHSWIHTLNNVAAIAVALLWADDYTSAVGKVVMTGWDTDSNGALVGSVAGILAGTRGIPERFTKPLHDRTRSALFGFDNSSISGLAARTIGLRERLGT